jgi:septal ring factor EnvC (AmiA/AmiB activator)
MKKNLISLILVLFLGFHALAQETTETGSLNEGTITSQFDYLNRISNNYQEYKVVKKTNLEKIRSNVLDSLNVFKNQLVTVNQELSTRQSKIGELEKQVSETNKQLEIAEAARDNFEFLGMAIHKSAYVTMMWTIVGILTAAFLFFLFRYSQSHRVISRAKKDLAETIEEFEQHRKNTLERERKLKRELVDAMNGRIH